MTPATAHQPQNGPPPYGGAVLVRARTIVPLRGEDAARGMDALTAPLQAIDDAVIAAQDGIILAVEPYRDFCRRANALPNATLIDLDDALLAPGFINCHTHLEISYMAGKTLPGKGFPAWVASLVALDRAEDPADAANALAKAVHDLRACGTAGVIDITSRRPEAVLAVLRGAGIAPRPCLEIIGHDAAIRQTRMEEAARDAAFSLAAHAFYSTPGEAFVAARAWCAAHERPFSMHLAEHADEVECLTTGSGRFYEALRERVIPEAWRAPMRRPVRYAHDLGLFASGTIAVHCVQCEADEVDLLATSPAALCLCPRSNSYIGVGEAPVRAFAEKGALLTLGTDSLASNSDLTLWHESEYFLQKNLLPPNALLRMATVNGASAAMLSRDAGSLDTGKRFCYSVFPRDTATMFRLS